MQRLFGVAAIAAATICCVLPTPVHAQEITDAESAKTVWTELKRKLRRKGFEFDLEQFATSAANLVETGTAGPDLEKFLRGTVIKDLRPLLSKKNKVRDGSCLASLANLCLALGDAESIDLLLESLDAYKDWEDLNRPAYRELAKRLQAGELTQAQAATLQERVEGVIKDAPRQMRFVFDAVRALTGDHAADRSEWGVNLIADDAFEAAKKQARQDASLLEEIAKMLGELWGTQPFLAKRVDVLLDLGRMGSPIDALARDGLRRITFQNFGLDGQPAQEIARFKRWWKDCEKACGGKPVPEDGDILAYSLSGRRDKAKEDGKEKDLQVDVVRLLQRWDSPRFRWATPILVSLFQWDPTVYTELRTNVVLTLRRIGDPRAAKSLLQLLDATNADGTAVLDKTSEAAVLRTLGYLAAADDQSVVDRLRVALRKATEQTAVRQAAAESLGRLQVAPAIDELLGFADEATGSARREALVAVARLGSDDAATRLLALWKNTADDERVNLVHAYGRFGTLPLPDAVANHLLSVWAAVDDLAKPMMRQAYKDELIPAFLGGLAEADPTKPAAEQKRYRGVAHPKFLALLRSVALDTDPKGKDRAKQVIDALTEVEDVESVADVMFEALSHDDPDRRAVAARWVAANVRASFRPHYLDMLLGTNLEHRVLAAGLLVKPAAWDADAVYPKFVEVIRTDGPKGQDDDKIARLIRTIMDGIRERPCKKYVKPLFELMDEKEGAWLNMQLHGVLFGWVTNSNAQKWALALRASRRTWEGFWDKYGDKVAFIGDDCEKN